MDLSLREDLILDEEDRKVKVIMLLRKMLKQSSGDIHDLGRFKRI